MNLPIDVVPGTKKFKWRQFIDGVPIEQEGHLSSSIEGSVIALIAIAKQLKTENEELRRIHAQLSEQVQSSKATNKSKITGPPPDKKRPDAPHIPS